MKTLDEVIDALEVCSQMDAECHKCPYGATAKGWCEEKDRDALDYLKEYRAELAQNSGKVGNDPLSWSELKQMEGMPVWIEGEHGCIWNQKSWVLIRLDKENDDLIICVGTDNGHYEFAINKEDYGTDWQAYRKERK